MVVIAKRGVAYGSYPALLISSYMLCPPRLMVRYCAAIMVRIEVSSLTIISHEQETLFLIVTVKLTWAGETRNLWNHNDHLFNVLFRKPERQDTKSRQLTLNFSPFRAARRIRSTSAAAIWFFTGSSLLRVLDMLNLL